MPAVLIALLWSLLAAAITAVAFHVAEVSEYAGVAALVAFVITLLVLVDSHRRS